MRAHALAIGLVLAFVVRVALAIELDSATMDEPEYITAGYSYIVTHDLRLDPWHPPLAIAAAGLAVRLRGDEPFAPTGNDWARADARRIARTFMYGPTADAEAILHAARIPSALFGVATVLLIGAWAKQLWGSARRRARARARGVRADARRARRDRDAGRDADVLHAAGDGRGVALRARAVVVALARDPRVHRARGRDQARRLLARAGDRDRLHRARARHRGADRRAWLRHVGRALLETAALAGAVILVAIAIGSGPAGLVQRFAHGLHDQLWHLGHLPPAYLHGHIGQHGFWAYYPIVLALKVPLGTLALVVLSSARRRWGTALDRATAMFVCVPPIILIAFVTWTRIDIGIRLVLPALPFAIVLASRAATFATPRARRFVIAALAATLASSASRRRASWRTSTSSRARPAARGAGCPTRTSTGARIFDRLDAYLRETHAPPIYLAYFGGGSPSLPRDPPRDARHRTGVLAERRPRWRRNEPGAPCRADRQLVAISALRPRASSSSARHSTTGSRG